MTHRANHEPSDARIMLAMIVLFFSWPFVAHMLGAG
jgi:hypothetical protein